VSDPCVCACGAMKTKYAVSCKACGAKRCSEKLHAKMHSIAAATLADQKKNCEKCGKEFYAKARKKCTRCMREDQVPRKRDSGPVTVAGPGVIQTIKPDLPEIVRGNVIVGYRCRCGACITVFPCLTCRLERIK
jgi:hypothetical protein